MPSSAMTGRPSAATSPVGETRAETGAVYALEITVPDLGHPFASTLSAEALRQISADALAAGEWLETHQ
jgi:hypothetical protein